MEENSAIKSSEKGLKKGERRHTIIAPGSDIEKMKYIAYIDRRKDKTVFSNAIQIFIQEWERVNGEITSEMIEKMGNEE